MNVTITGAAGFLGRHMQEAARRMPGVVVWPLTKRSSAEDWRSALAAADVVFHLAGVNRPKDAAEYWAGNSTLTAEICQTLRTLQRKPVLILASSIQAVLDNPYGLSKREAEAAVRKWAEETGARAVIFRLPNVFGKWCRPNYNSVVATFAHNIAHDLPISISDPDRELELVYIDDVVAAMLASSLSAEPGCGEGRVALRHEVTLGALAKQLTAFRESRRTLVLPSFEDALIKRLYATYLSYLEPQEFAYPLEQRVDPRGCLAEFLKSQQFGQLFVSRTKPGITRGNHFHQTKTEKFLVVEGEAVVRFRHVEGGPVIEHRVSGTQFRVVDIPPGYTHSIENVGLSDLVTLFWASEIFDPQHPDTVMLPVLP